MSIHTGWTRGRWAGGRLWALSVPSFCPQIGTAGVWVLPEPSPKSVASPTDRDLSLVFIPKVG